MRPLTEEMMQEYKRARQSGETMTLRAWVEQRARRDSAMSPRARQRAASARINPAPGTIPPNVGDRIVRPIAVGGGPNDGTIDPVEPATPASAKTAPRVASTAVRQGKPSPAIENPRAGINKAKESAGPGVDGVGENAGTQAGDKTANPEASGGKPGTPAPASTTAPVDQGTGSDAQTATMEQVQARAELWNRRLAELEAEVTAGRISPTEYMRENARFEEFMAAAEAGDYAGAMAAQNPFDGGSATDAAPRRGLAEINAERARNGLRPLSQDVYDAMPERGAQTAARAYGDQGGQILSNEYASESQMNSAPRMSQIIAGAGGDPAEIQRRMQSMGSTSIIDDVSGMTPEQIAGNRYSAALEDWRRQNAPAAAQPAGPTPATGSAPGPAKPAQGPAAAKAGDPTPMPVTGSGGAGSVGTGAGSGVMGGFGAAQEVAPLPQPMPQPPVETRPQAPREINPVGGPKPATNPNPRLPPIPMADGKPPVTPPSPKPTGIGTDPMEPPANSGATGARPIGGSIGLPPRDTRAQGRADYMALRNPPAQPVAPPPNGKILGDAATGAASLMRAAGTGLSNGVKGVGGMVSSGIGGVKNALQSAAGTVGSAVGNGVAAVQNVLQQGGKDPRATSGEAAANITGAPAAPTGGPGGNADFNSTGGLTQTGRAAFGGAQIAQNQQRSREQAVAYMQSNRSMR